MPPPIPIDKYGFGEGGGILTDPEKGLCSRQATTKPTNRDQFYVSCADRSSDTHHDHIHRGQN